MVNPSDVYIKLIQPHAPILRGMGFYAPADSVLASYVKVEANEQLRTQLTAELADLLSKRRSLPEHPLGGDPTGKRPQALSGTRVVPTQSLETSVSEKRIS